MSQSIVKKTVFWSRACRGIFLGLAVASLMLAAGTARADCGNLGGQRAGIAPMLPLSARFANGQAADTSIVGLWHVTYTSGGQLFYEAFDQWHSDGTEFENANLPSVYGNVCMGVWKKVSALSVKLYHIGWNFDGSGNSIGTFTLDETNTVAADGKSYQGTFVYRVYDLAGNLVQEAKGTLKATRIMVN